MLHPVIMAGGSGSRLWPLSRQLNPKQFLRLAHAEFSMLQATLTRLDGIETAPPLLLCNEQHRFLVAEQLRQLGEEHATLLLEPEGRNTAPAIALAAMERLQEDPDATLLILAADHLIQDTEAFQYSIRQALPLAGGGRLVTFGIVPTHAETGYGYIEQGQPLNEGGYQVARFVEKPDAETAATYLASGGYFWNSGMFLFNAQRYLDELRRQRPDILEACEQAMEKTDRDMDFTRVDADSFHRCPAESVDYAVMEHTQDAAMVPLDAGWSDIGSWHAVWEVNDKDEAGNVVQGDALTRDTRNSLIHARHRLVATLGIEDLIIVDTQDALLVAAKDRAQDVKKLVETLQGDERAEALDHREVYRPWGVYDSVDEGPRYKVKRITVKPGAKLSVQMHHHRAEHWVVVSGIAKVTNGENTYLVGENESTFIPVGQIHALENPGTIDLHLIEVQSGSYLGEDDIVRFEDRYGRS